MNLKKPLLALSVFMALLISSAVPTATAADNQDNLTENVAELQEQVSSLKGQVSSLKENISQLETSLNSLASENELGTLENEMDDRLAAFIDNFTDNFRALRSEQENRMGALENSLENRMAENFSELRENVVTTLSEVSAAAGSFENRVGINEEKIDSLYNRSDLMYNDIQGEKKENPWKISFLTGFIVVGVVIGGFLLVGWKNGMFDRLIPEDRRTPELQIWAALNRLDYYYDQMEKHGAEQFRPLIEGQKETIRALRDRWPEKYEEVIKNDDVSGLKEKKETPGGTEERGNVRA